MTKTFEDRIREAREAAGLSQTDVAFESRFRAPAPFRISQTKLHRLESGKIGEDAADPYDIQFLAWLYNTTASELSQVAADRIETWENMLADQGIHATGWLSSMTFRELIPA